MKKILLTANGLCTDDIKNTFLRLVPKKYENLKIAIIPTAQAKLKEKHQKAVLARDIFQDMGINKIEFVDVEFDDVQKLMEYDIILINGGDPFYLIYHLKKSGADRILRELVDDGKIIIGISAGSMVLGLDIAVLNYIYPEDNIFKAEDLSALKIVNMRIYPHFKEHCEADRDWKDKICGFETRHNCEITRLNNEQAVLVLDNKIEKIG